MSFVMVHGGAGRVAPARHAVVVQGVHRAAAAAQQLLRGGGSALEAVELAVRIMEDDPELNAGRGSSLTRDGTVETDAAIMDGWTRRVGAVAAVPDLANPVLLARAVLEDGQHVLLAAEGAWRFGRERGFVPAAPGALITEVALARWREEDARHRGSLPAGSGEIAGGTVGAVACDHLGHLAAATSTGGLTYKRCGRIGDSPIPGAGTWADRDAAVSATGDGEDILRVTLSRQVADRIRAGAQTAQALHQALDDFRLLSSGDAGVIVVTPSAMAARTTTLTMPVAWSFASGEVRAVLRPEDDFMVTSVG
jgi:beta-aspartyl-peptidase (threonine type)